MVSMGRFPVQGGCEFIRLALDGVVADFPFTGCGGSDRFIFDWSVIMEPSGERTLARVLNAIIGCFTSLQCSLQKASIQESGAASLPPVQTPSTKVSLSHDF